ncbi:MAG: hypothetical protein WKF96_06645 [Solirubrobacteraceae bacterium]
MLTDPANADPYKADIYPLAKTLWVLATGQQFAPPGHQPAGARPYRIADQNPHQHAELLDGLVDTCTLLDPVARPSMQKVAAELKAWMGLADGMPALDVAELAAEYRSTASAELSAAEQRERLLDAFAETIRRVETRLQPLFDAIRQFDSRAQLATQPPRTTNPLRAHRAGSRAQPQKRWSPTPKPSANGAHHAYVLHLGRAVHAYDDATIAVHGFISLGPDGVMQSDLFTTTEVRHATGPAEIQAAIEALGSELAEVLRQALEIFVDRRRERG